MSWNAKIVATEISFASNQRFHKAKDSTKYVLRFGFGKWEVGGKIGQTNKQIFLHFDVDILNLIFDKVHA